MFITYGRSVSIMVLYAIALHLVWSVILVFDDSATNATAVYALFRYIHPPLLLAGIIAIAALLALASMFSNRPQALALLLMPQQILLMMSAAGAIEAIWISQFADGVIRPRAFLAADQIYGVLAAIGHTAAIMVRVMRGRSA